MDDLVEFIWRKIGLTGCVGMGSDDFVLCIEEFYAWSNRSGTNDEPSLSKDTVFLEYVWKWVTQHKEILVGHDGRLEGISWQTFHDISRITSYPEQACNVDINGILERANEARSHQWTVDENGKIFVNGILVTKIDLRVFTTEKQYWMSICGHGIDYKRVSSKEFQLLSLIALKGSLGIGQNELIRLSGQDKRSIPKRTDKLFERGYIIKKAVIIGGTRTSLLTLRSLVDTCNESTAHINVFNGEGNALVATYEPNTTETCETLVEDGERRDLRIRTNSTIHLNRIIDAVYLALKDTKVLTLEDLRRALGIVVPKEWPRKFLQRTLEKLSMIGIICRIRARVEYPVDVGSQRCVWKKAVKLIRVPTERDKELFESLSVKDAAQWSVQDQLRRKNGDAYIGVNESDDEEDEEEVLEPINTAKVINGEMCEAGNKIVAESSKEGNELLSLNTFRSTWEPERHITNQIYTVVHQAGEKGLSSMELRNRTFGPFWRRPFDIIMDRLTDAWEHSQPNYLKHLSIVKDTALTDKQIHFVYRSRSNYALLVNQGKANWDVVKSTSHDSQRKTVLTNQLDCSETFQETRSAFHHVSRPMGQWGFPQVDQRFLFKSTGRGRLLDIVKACESKGNEKSFFQRAQRTVKCSGSSASNNRQHHVPDESIASSLSMLPLPIPASQAGSRPELGLGPTSTSSLTITPIPLSYSTDIDDERSLVLPVRYELPECMNYRSCLGEKEYNERDIERISLRARQIAIFDAIMAIEKSATLTYVCGNLMKELTEKLNLSTTHLHQLLQKKNWANLITKELPFQINITQEKYNEWELSLRQYEGIVVEDLRNIQRNGIYIYHGIPANEAFSLIIVIKLTQLGKNTRRDEHGCANAEAGPGTAPGLPTPGFKKKGGLHVSGGLMMFRRSEILRELVTRCGGAAPGGNELYRPFCDVWNERYGGLKPDVKTMARVISIMIESGSLQRQEFEFFDKFSRTIRKTVIYIPSTNNCEKQISFVCTAIQSAYPDIYIPTQLGDYSVGKRSGTFRDPYFRDIDSALDVERIELPAWVKSYQRRAERREIERAARQAARAALIQHKAERKKSNILREKSCIKESQRLSHKRKRSNTNDCSTNQTPSSSINVLTESSGQLIIKQNLFNDEWLNSLRDLVRDICTPQSSNIHEKLPDRKKLFKRLLRDSAYQEAVLMFTWIVGILEYGAEQSADWTCVIGKIHILRRYRDRVRMQRRVNPELFNSLSALLRQQFPNREIFTYVYFTQSVNIVDMITQYLHSLTSSSTSTPIPPYHHITSTSFQQTASCEALSSSLVSKVPREYSYQCPPISYKNTTTSSPVNVPIVKHHHHPRNSEIQLPATLEALTRYTRVLTLTSEASQAYFEGVGESFYNLPSLTSVRDKNLHQIPLLRPVYPSSSPPARPCTREPSADLITFSSVRSLIASGEMESPTNTDVNVNSNATQLILRSLHLKNLIAYRHDSPPCYKNPVAWSLSPTFWANLAHHAIPVSGLSSAWTLAFTLDRLLSNSPLPPYPLPVELSTPHAILIINLLAHARISLHVPLPSLWPSELLPLYRTRLIARHAYRLPLHLKLTPAYTPLASLLAQSLRPRLAPLPDLFTSLRFTPLWQSPTNRPLPTLLTALLCKILAYLALHPGTRLSRLINVLRCTPLTSPCFTSQHCVGGPSSTTLQHCEIFSLVGWLHQSHVILSQPSPPPLTITSRLYPREFWWLVPMLFSNT